MGKICSKINIFKKKSDVGIALLPIREKKSNLPRLIDITKKRYRKKSKKRRSYNK